MEPTARDVDQLIGPATPHFAYQIRQRVENLVGDLPAAERAGRLTGASRGSKQDVRSRVHRFGCRHGSSKD